MDAPRSNLARKLFSNQKEVDKINQRLREGKSMLGLTVEIDGKKYKISTPKVAEYSDSVKEIIAKYKRSE